VGVVLWLEAGLAKSRNVKLNLSRLVELGITRQSAHRAVKNLEAARLISISRHPGRQLEITLVEAPDTD
jgi:hypothetical protein